MRCKLSIGYYVLRAKDTFTPGQGRVNAGGLQNRMKIKDIFVTGMIAVTCVAGVTGASWARNHKDKSWTPDSVTSGKMDPLVTIAEDYQVRPPAGWEVAGRGGPGKVGKAFMAPVLPNKARPYVQVMLLGLPDFRTTKRTADDFLTLRLRNFQSRIDPKTWKADKPEDGTINGIKFARIHFSGSYGEEKTPEQGFLYVARDHYWVVEISGFDADPTTTQDIKFAEATALSFIKTPQILSKPPAGLTR